MNFHPFVLPFLIGFVLFFVITACKFTLWIRHLTVPQKKTIRDNIISRKTFISVWEAIREGLIHRNIYKKNPLLGFMHTSLALGWFLLIIVGKIESSVYFGKTLEAPWETIFFRFFAHGIHSYPGAKFFAFSMDFLLMVILLGVLLALTKRLHSNVFGMKKTTQQAPLDRIALTTLWFVFPLRLLAESSTSALYSGGSFLTASVGKLLTGVVTPEVSLGFWWGYSIAIGFFLSTLPFSRYMHIPTEILYIFLKNWGVTSQETITGFTQIQVNSCSRCGICIDVCQLNTAAKINNVQSVYLIRDYRYQQLKESVADQCLLCGRCVEACPVNLELTLIRKQVREKNAPSHNIPIDCTLQIHKSNAEIIYFAGCMTHLTPSIISAMKKIFSSAKVSYHFLDEQKGICCGKPLIQQGLLSESRKLRDFNTQLIHNTNAKTLVVSCPICYKSFTEEYSLNVEVLHHSEYIERLLHNGRLRIKKSSLKMVYHDPCELSRKNSRKEEPRNVLQQIAKLIPTSVEKNNSICCGGSLASTGLPPEKRKQITNHAIQKLTENKPDFLITSCPLCKKTFHQAKLIEVLDIAEISAMHLHEEITPISRTWEGSKQLAHLFSGKKLPETFQK